MKKTSVISHPFYRGSDPRLDCSEVCNLLAAQWAAVLSFADPLLNALSVENMQFVAVQCRDEIVAQEVAPADRALAPQASLAVVGPGAALPLRMLRLLVLELGLI